MESSILHSIIWASFLIYLLYRLELLYKEALKKKEPLANDQYSDLKRKLESIQVQVNNLSLIRGLESEND